MSSKLKDSLYKMALGFVPLLIVWSIDWYTKNWAAQLKSIHQFGPLRLELVYNHGLMLGLSSQLPHAVKIVTFTTMGAIVLTGYIVLITIVPIKSLFIRLGLSILVGGIIGNVSDRLVNGAVIDFIAINFNPHNTVVFNGADIFQWIGYASIIFGLYQDYLYYWPKLELRNKFFINPSFQFRAGLIMGLGSFVTGFIFLVFGLSFFQENLAYDTVKFYMAYGSGLIVFLSIVNFCLGVVLSHRVAGPVYAIGRYLNDSIEGKNIPLQLRKNDEFKELEIALTKINAELHRLHEIEKNVKDPGSRI